jgi:hypothetical protein
MDRDASQESRGEAARDNAVGIPRSYMKFGDDDPAVLAR